MIRFGTLWEHEAPVTQPIYTAFDHHSVEFGSFGPLQAVQITD